MFGEPVYGHHHCLQTASVWGDVVLLEYDVDGAPRTVDEKVVGDDDGLSGLVFIKHAIAYILVDGQVFNGAQDYLA